MNTTVNVVFYKSKTLSDGSHPLMIRISKDNKKKYKSLGVSILPQYWDFEKQRPRKNCPNREAIQTLINEKSNEYSNQITEYQLTQKKITMTKLIEKVDSPLSNKTVEDFVNKEITKLKDVNRLKSSNIYKELHSSMLEFNKHLDIYFSGIRVNLMTDFRVLV